MRLLLIEDDAKIASFVMKGLSAAGFAVDHAVDGEEGLDLGLSEPYDVIIVDLMLPKRDGLSVIEALRREKIKTPVIILSAKDSVDDRVKGLEIGSDDYLTKPFAFSELLARVQALMRRASGTVESTRLSVDDLSLDLVTRDVVRDGHKIELQPLEYSLLAYLMRNAGKVVSKTMIMEHVWHYNFRPPDQCGRSAHLPVERQNRQGGTHTNCCTRSAGSVMSFAGINRLRQSLAFRLTVWYAVIFVLSSAIAFALFYLLITQVVRQRTDDDLRIQANGLYQIHLLQGVQMMRRAAVLKAQATGEQKMFFRLFYPSGVSFSSSNMIYWNNIGIDRDAVAAILEGGASYRYATQKVPRKSYAARIIYKRIDRSIILQLGYSLEDEERLVNTFERTFFIAMAALLAIAVAMGWFMARRALSGVAMVTRTARQISESDLESRVPLLHRHDEIDLLAFTFNQMLDRIQQLVISMRQMNDNIAHDLRSPITRIRGLAEVTLTGAEGMEDYTQMAASTIEECDRLLQMINTMLAISRTEAGIDPDGFQPVDMAAAAKEACDLFQPLADDKAIDLQCNCETPCLVQGDPPMLQRVLANLIDNAIKYTPSRGMVRVDVEPDGEICVIRVEDSGPGVPAEDRTRIFQRFFPRRSKSFPWRGRIGVEPRAGHYYGPWGGDQPRERTAEQYRLLGSAADGVHLITAIIFNMIKW